MSTISFLSTRGRAMNIDLKITQNYLSSALPDTTFDYFMKNTATKIPAANQQLEKARLSFCKNAKKLLCMDASIPIKLAPASSEERRILTLSPYDYLFNEYMKYVEDPSLARKKTFIRCTHVMPGAPFFSKLLKNFYEFENTTFIEDVCLPAAWDILQENRQTEIKNNFEYLYPQAKGKKILCILTANQNLNEESTALFSDLDFKALLDKLGDDWFLITNNMNLLDKSIRLSYEYTNRFGYMKGRFNLNDLIYFSDMLVTNSSKHACTFAAAAKPVYYLNYGKKHFGRYMKQFHPDLYLETAGELTDLDYTQEDLSETEVAFCKEFAYSTKKNPLEELLHCLA